MDPVRFDGLVRSLSNPSTRRRMFTLLTALPLSGILTALLVAKTDAKGRHKRRKKRNKRRSGDDKQNRKGNRKGDDKGKDKCTKQGQAPTKGTPCCQGLIEEGGLCTQPAPPPGCIPTTCAAQGKTCGSIPDGCGGTLTCGSCANPTPVCVNNICVACTVSSPCASNQLCDGGACQTCTVTCPSGNPTTCGNGLQATITAAAPGATLYVCPGTYKSPPNTDPFTLSDRGFLIEGAGKSITIIGAGQDDEEATNTILHANPGGTTDSRRVMTINAGVAEVTLRGLRITGGAGITAGGGISNDGDTLRLTECTVAGNQANLQGGGIFMAVGSLLMTDCHLVGNHVTGMMASGGGGIETGGPMTLTNCTLSGNTSTNSGGAIKINADGQTITLDGTVIGPGNTAITAGGGIDNLRGILNLLHASQVTGNHAGSTDGGGGIFNGAEGSLNISSDSSVTGNTAGDPPVPNNCAGTAPASGTCGPS